MPDIEDLALNISTSSPRVREYALAQVAATVALEARLDAVEKILEPPPPPQTELSVRRGSWLWLWREQPPDPPVEG